MTTTRAASWLLLAAGFAAGAWRDAVPARPPLWIAGFRVLEGDFHVHAFFGDGWVAPWDLPGEARRRGLDVFAITNHNQTFAARLARFWAPAGAPIVLVGEEVTAARFHIAAVGVERKVEWRQSAAAVLDAIHAQGGIGIAAHPIDSFAAAYDDAALARLDGVEVSHPTAQHRERAAQLAAFWRDVRARGFRPAPIGSSDFHALAGLGLCRTYVFARDATAAAVMDALRARRTVVFDREGVAYGDPSLAAPLRAGLAARRQPAATGVESALDSVGRVAGLLGLLGLLLGPRHVVEDGVEREDAGAGRDPLRSENGA